MILALEWSDVGEEKLAAHHVDPEEVDQVIANDYVTRRNRTERAGSIQMIGRTDGGRYLTIILATTHEEGVFRVITGWDSTKAEKGKLG